jgi:hypothetical protein
MSSLKTLYEATKEKQPVSTLFAKVVKRLGPKSKTFIKRKSFDTETLNTNRSEILPSLSAEKRPTQDDRDLSPFNKKSSFRLSTGSEDAANSLFQKSLAITSSSSHESLGTTNSFSLNLPCVLWDNYDSTDSPTMVNRTTPNRTASASVSPKRFHSKNDIIEKDSMSLRKSISIFEKKQAQALLPSLPSHTHQRSLSYSPSACNELKRYCYFSQYFVMSSL